MHVMTVVGARPEFLKAGLVSSVLRRHHEEILIHTGQHYDYRMSGIFFEELGLPRPDVCLCIGSGSHGEQTGRMLAALEQTMLEYWPDRVLIYGDTNSTLAVVLAAAKLSIPVDHVEAGLRSFNRTMPEEINRLVADRLSDLLFCPTRTAIDHLHAEGRQQGVYLVGDVVVDALRVYLPRALEESTLLRTLHLHNEEYILITLHRPATVDDSIHFARVLDALSSVPLPVLFPMHPRTEATLRRFELVPPHNVILLEPLGYIDMLAAIASAAVVVTDSGGVQKEAYLLHVPCVTVRTETEWPETLCNGWNRLAFASAAEIASSIMAARVRPPVWEPMYGDGHAAERIVEHLNQVGGRALSG